MKPSVLAGIVVTILVIIGGFLYLQSDGTENTSDTSVNESSEEISAEMVASHNSENDCWTIINGNVYDITAYIPRHPGGDEILRACGSDGSTLFNSRTTEDKEEIGSGTPHSSNAASQLVQLKIGVLAD